MERLQSSEAVIIETVAQASEMTDVFAIRDQMAADDGDSMIVTGAAEDVIVDAGDEAGRNVRGDFDGRTMVSTDEPDGDNMDLTDVENVQNHNFVLVTWQGNDDTGARGQAREDTVVVTGEHGEEITVVVTSASEENTMVGLGNTVDPVTVTAPVDSKMQTSCAGDAEVLKTKAGDAEAVTGCRMTGTEIIEGPVQDSDDTLGASGMEEVHAPTVVVESTSDALDLSLLASDADGVTGKATKGAQADSGSGPVKDLESPAQHLLNQIEQQTEEVDKLQSDAVKPHCDATEKEENEIIFVCVHGQTFRCKPQAGKPVEASEREPAGPVYACACSKSKKPPCAKADVSLGSDRKLRDRKQKFICNRCGGRFTQQASLDRHMFSHEDETEQEEAKAETSKAGKKSKISSSSRRRTRQQHKEAAATKPNPDLSCPDCDEVFSRLESFASHKEQHTNDMNKKTKEGETLKKLFGRGLTGKKQFKCERCGMVLESRYRLQRHEEDHLSPGESFLFPCKDCSKVFTRMFNLRRHEKVHRVKKGKKSTEETLKTMSCKDCFKVFTRPLHLLRHEKLHIKESKLINCSLCPETFEDRFSYIAHNRTHTMKNYYREMICEVCQRIVKGPVTLKRHMRTHTKEKPYPCRNGCNSSFSSTSYRLSHERMHCRKGQNYLCTKCGEIFINKSKLVSHETKVHRGGLDEHGNLPNKSELPCRFCGRIFHASAVRKRHERIHTNEKPYMCQYCPKSFVHDNALQCHERVHTKERPYKCDLCSKAFSQSGHLRTHMRVHTKEKPYNCRFCKQAFSHLGSRKNHERKHKDDIVMETKSQADSEFVVVAETQETLPVCMLHGDAPSDNPEMAFENLEESRLQQDGLEEHLVVACEDVQDHELQDVPDGMQEGMQEDIQQPEMEDMAHKIILSHPEHEMQAAVILQLLESGNRMPNFEGFVNIVQS